MSANKPQPSIRFGGKEVPAHQIWTKTKLLYGVNEFLAQLNDRMPEFATEQTVALVPEVRRRLKAIEVAMPKRFEPSPEMKEAAKALLKLLSLELALESFNADQDVELQMSEFVELIGPRAYHKALRAEAREWEVNQILPIQTADIWNEQERPAPGNTGGWTGKMVEHLLSGGYT